MTSVVAQNLPAVRERIARACARAGRDPQEVTLLAVTKSHPVEVLHQAVEAGLLDLGENRVQEALAKLPHAPSGARIHLIGRLQSNKVNKAVGHFASIASVDREDLLRRLGRRAAELEVVQPIWLEVNVTEEPRKGGCDPEEVKPLWALAREAPGLQPLGLMGMGRLDAGERENRELFARLRALAEPLRRAGGSPALLNMGMSDDFEWAILEGAHVVRLGTVLFGPRPPRDGS